MSEIHPEKNLILEGANVLTIKKNNKKYGMTFAWGMQADEDKLLAIIGGQSVTGHQLEKGDKVGISCLNIDQSTIAHLFGDYHSDLIDKFDNDYLEEIDGVLLIKEATRELVCEVIDILYLPDNNEDFLIYFKVKKKINNPKGFLDYYSIK